MPRRRPPSAFASTATAGALRRYRAKRYRERDKRRAAALTAAGWRREGSRWLPPWGGPSGTLGVAWRWHVQAIDPYESDPHSWPRKQRLKGSIRRMGNGVVLDSRD